jgi:signal transduction histidine kinase
VSDKTRDVASEALRLLLIEDNPGDADLVREYLRGAHDPAFALHVVETLQEGLALLRAEKFAAVLLDLSLPDAQGVTTVQAVHAAAPDTAVVVLTGLDDEDVGLSTMIQGAQDYLVKARLAPDSLVRSLKFAMERTRYERAARALAEEQAARAEAERLNRQLDETNRGILALYAELDEKTDSLRRTAEVKSRVVSNVSHEFRTPLNSILGLTRLLLSRADGPLTPEQEKQLGFIFRSATELSELVTDLLDLSKMESGRIRLHATRFRVDDLLSAMRGLSRPLVRREAVRLVFEDAPADVPQLETDEAKVSQVLRNLI